MTPAAYWQTITTACDRVGIAAYIDRTDPCLTRYVVSIPGKGVHLTAECRFLQPGRASWSLGAYTFAALSHFTPLVEIVNAHPLGPIELDVRHEMMAERYSPGRHRHACSDWE